MHRVVFEKQGLDTVAMAFGVSVRTVRKRVGRYRAEGKAGLFDRSSRPHPSPKPTPTDVEGTLGPIARLNQALDTLC